MKKIIRITFIFILMFFSFILPIKAKEKVKLYLFYGQGCPHCREEEKFLKTLDKKKIDIIYYEVWYDKENAEIMQKVKKVFNIKSEGVPATLIGETILIGYSNSTKGVIKKAIDYYANKDYVDVVEKIKNNESLENFYIEDKFNKNLEKDLTISTFFKRNISLKNISLISSAVILGLIDGFNPCAMWVLLFLISMLLGMKDKKRMWVLGLTFLFTSAFVYMLIMLSWISIALKMTTIIWIRNLIALIALLGAGFNVRSYLNSKNSGCEIVDEKKRKKIIARIKKFTKEKTLIIALIGVIFLAISVNMVELACSAGLPLVFTELLILNDVSNICRFLYTLVYIMFFLLDDLIIFFIAVCTMNITSFSTKYNKYSHLLGAIFMFMIGILLLFKPEWLMFQFR